MLLDAVQDLTIAGDQALFGVIRRVQIVRADIDEDPIRLQIIDAVVHSGQKLLRGVAADAPVVDGVRQLLVQQQFIDRELLHQAAAHEQDLVRPHHFV